MRARLVFYARFLPSHTHHFVPADEPETTPHTLCPSTDPFPSSAGSPPLVHKTPRENSCAQSLCNLIRFAIRLDYLIECGVVSALVRLADPGDEATSECCAAALYLFFCHPAVLALIDGREVKKVLFVFSQYGGRGKSH